MKFLIQILLDYWPLLSPVVYEMIVRIWPTRWNVSILDNAWKIINAIIPNNRVPDGNENGLGTDARGKVVNKIKVKMGRHILRSLLVVFLFSATVSAQQWQNFKGIRLVNESDTTEQLAIEGSIFYDDLSRNFYGRDQWGWKALIGGGGGGAFWPLSGAADATATINGGTKIIRNNSGAPPTRGGFELSSSIGGAGIWGGPAATFSAAGIGLNFTGSEIIAKGTVGVGFGGIVYSEDVSANFTNRSLADWGNVWKVKGTTDLTGIVSIKSTSGATLNIGDPDDVDIINNINLYAGNASYNASSHTFAGTTTLPTLTSIGNVSSTEISYVDGVTSSIQTQIDSKIDGTMVAGRVPFGMDANTLTTNAKFVWNNVSNQIVLTNTAGTHITSLFGGEIQLDNPGGSDDVTFTNTGISVTGLGSAYDINSSSGVKLTGNITIAPTSSASQLYGGLYNPIGASIANASSVSASTDTNYYRIGDRVTVFGIVSVASTSATAETIFTLTLPIASNLSSTNDLAGTFSGRENDGSTIEQMSGSIFGYTTGDAAYFSFDPLSAGAPGEAAFSYQYSYVIK